MKIGAINNPKYNLLDEIRWIGEHNFDFIDLTIEPPGAYDVDVKEVKKALKYYNLDIIGHTNPFLPYIFPISSLRKVCLEEFKKYIKIFSSFGVKFMNIHPSYNGPMMSEEEKIERNIEFIKEINSLCRDRNITLMVENFLDPFDNPGTFQRILDEVKDMKLHLDVGHCNINQKENSAEKFFQRFKEDIVHLHFSDNRGQKDDHLPLGCGNINWEKIIKMLKKYRYDSTITLEIFTPDRNYLLKSKEKLEELLKG